MSLFRVGIFAAALALSGCLATVGPDYEPPALATPAAYSVAPPIAGELPARWWRGFDDAALAQLVERALADNLDIAAAQARLEEARALIGVARSDGAPALDAGADAGGDGTLAGESSTTRSNPQGEASGGLLFSWVPDLFGGRARGVEAAEAEARRRDWLRTDIARLAAADTARRFIEIRRNTTRLALLGQSLELQDQTLDLVQRRFDVGLAAQLDVSRARAQQAATQARRGPLVQDIAASRSALAVLTGQFPQELNAATAIGVPAYAGAPVAGLPRDVLRHRADLRAAEANLARATAEIGVATAALYPRLSIPGSLTASVVGIGSGTVVERLVAALAVSIDIPLFDAGGRRAQVTASEARAQEALIVYRATLLRAVAEAESALLRLTAAEQRRDELIAAVDASETAYEQANQLYEQGLVGFLDVLDAQRTLLETRQDLPGALADVALAVVDFYAAIGAPVEREAAAS